MHKRTRRRYQARLKPAGYLMEHLRSIRSDAKRRGKECDLDLEWAMTELALQRNCCAVTGIPFVYPTMEQPLIRAFSPSFDRLDNSRGYVRENVQIVCYMYNVAKNSFLHEDVVTLARAICARETV